LLLHIFKERLSAVTFLAKADLLFFLLLGRLS
jgi:hypothetical protein